MFLVNECMSLLSGDVNVPFTLQSCSKPLTYAMALETLGPDVVHQYVGTEPSGRNFNELVLDYNSAYQLLLERCGVT